MILGYSITPYNNATTAVTYYSKNGKDYRETEIHYRYKGETHHLSEVREIDIIELWSGALKIAKHNNLELIVNGKSNIYKKGVLQ